MRKNLTVDSEAIRAFCQRNLIRKLSFFGSVLRDDFTPHSDVDVMVDFAPEANVGLISLAGMEIELGRLLGRRAEIHTVKGINPLFRDNVKRGT